jgi:galactofuranosylgalactofuranosylrhamnosyl-N-acetylglucosaminyl-diphospho-decaprenol beta-1,5/1,6-galactofuranosyltransferase
MNAEQPTAHILQRVEFSTDPARSGLFHHGLLGEELVELVSGGETLTVPRGVTASFDTWFGIFPERSWFSSTSVEHVELRVRCAGRGRLVVKRETPQLDEYRLFEKTITDETAVFAFARNDAFSAEAGRVWFEVEALDDLEIIEAAWTTVDPPADVAANVVFCTFNRLPYLRRIIGAIVAHPTLAETVGRVTVVNQGDPFDLSSFPEIAGSALETRIHLIEQDNLGGCGGFSRGMWETLRSPELTHVVLLDDDIELHAESLARAISFLGHAHDDVALGGAMLDLFHPTHLYEAGALLDAANLLPRPILHDLDLADPEAMPELMGRPEPDYNGWWFFAVAADHIRQIGLPLPCFIRGDDIEYGIRLRQAGIRTITVTGMGVWHEPFYAKLGGWQQYFENRNLLAMASLRRVASWPAIRRHLLRSFFGNIVRSRYHSAAFTVMAMEDYLSGSEACVATTDAELRRCREVTDEIGPLITREPGATPAPVDRSKATSASPTTSPGPSKVAALLRAPKRAALLVERVRRAPAPDAESSVRQANDPAWILGALDQYRVVVADEQVAELVRRPDLERDLWQRFWRSWVRIRPDEGLRTLESVGVRPWQSFWDETFDEQDHKASTDAT